MGNIKVKTVFAQQYSGREPEITEYKTNEEAQAFIKTCLRWGIGIISCDIIKKEKNT